MRRKCERRNRSQSGTRPWTTATTAKLSALGARLAKRVVTQRLGMLQGEPGPQLHMNLLEPDIWLARVTHKTMAGIDHRRTQRDFSWRRLWSNRSQCLSALHLRNEKSAPEMLSVSGILNQ